jgi:hypothetical protein
MSTKEVATRLVELCRQGKCEEAQRELFADDAVSVEPHATPGFDQETKGLEAIFEKGRKFDMMLQQLHHVDVTEPLVAGNTIAFKLTMEVTMKERPKETWEEICVYDVKDGKIVSEEFFI